MSFLSSLFGRGESKVADASALTWTTLLGGNGASKTGLSVSELTALRVSTVYACCRVLCEDVGKLPLKLMLESSGGKTQVARKHPLHKVLGRRPNQWQTSMEWRMTMLLHALLGKGAYSYISRSSKGEVLELIPMLPGSVLVRQAPDWSISYEWTGSGGKKLQIAAEEVHALHGLSWDGVRALEVINQGREAIGLAMAAEETQARLHGQGARPGGIVTTPAKLGESEVLNIKKTFAEGYTGVDNAFKTLLLDNGLEFKPWAMNGVDGQHLQTRQHQVEEICRFFRVFPSMIGAGDKAATYASAEAFFGAHVVHSLTPWATLWEQALERDLLTPAEEDAGYYVKFSLDGLLRGSSEARALFYKSAINDGWMTRNEVRRLEDLNPMPGLDEFLRPLNMQSGNGPPNPPGKPDPAPVPPDPGLNPPPPA
jgi:HK97 family phage portal protein